MASPAYSLKKRAGANYWKRAESSQVRPCPTSSWVISLQWPTPFAGTLLRMLIRLVARGCIQALGPAMWHRTSNNCSCFGFLVRPNIGQKVFQEANEDETRATGRALPIVSLGQHLATRLRKESSLDWLHEYVSDVWARRCAVTSVASVVVSVIFSPPLPSDRK